MRLLLDTHVLLWWQTDPAQLSGSALEAISDRRNTIFMSVVNVWEMQIKAQSGKLTLPGPLPELIRRQQIRNGFELLQIAAAHIYELDALPVYHRDPFDRLLIAQSRQENLTFVSHDSMMRNYSNDVLW